MCVCVCVCVSQGSIGRPCNTTRAVCASLDYPPSSSWLPSSSPVAWCCDAPGRTQEAKGHLKVILLEPFLPRPGHWGVGTKKSLVSHKFHRHKDFLAAVSEAECDTQHTHLNSLWLAESVALLPCTFSIVIYLVVPIFYCTQVSKFPFKKSK